MEDLKVYVLSHTLNINETTVSNSHCKGLPLGLCKLKKNIEYICFYFHAAKKKVLYCVVLLLMTLRLNCVLHILNMCLI